MSGVLDPVRPKLSIRSLEASERPALVPLLAELLRFNGMPVPSDARIQAGIAEQQRRRVEILVAFAPEGPVGFASFTYFLPSEENPTRLYMKELYITATWRGAGVGRALMRELAGIAAARGAARIEWTTAASNEDAVAFYRRLGAREVAETVHFRLDAADIEAIAQRGGGS